VCGRAGDQGENLISQGLGAALIGVQAEDPIAFADFDRTVAQIAEAIERHLDHTRAQRGGDLSGAVDAERIHYTTSSAHSTLETAAAIFSASL